MNKSVIIIFLVFIAVSCENTYNGSVDISGYCYAPCSQSPLKGFQVEYVNRDIRFETYTDDNGYFELNETYQFDYHISKHPESGHSTVRDTSVNRNTCGLYRIQSNFGFSGDTINFYHSFQSFLRIKMDPNLVTSPLDTIFLFYDESCRLNELTKYRTTRTTDSSYSSLVYHKFVVGPFQNDQILDTITSKIPPYSRVNRNYGGAKYFYSGPNIYNRNRQSAYYTTHNIFDVSTCNQMEEAEVRIE